METIKYLDFDCVPLENPALSLLVTCSVGPRILSLQLQGNENMLAVLPNFVTKRPDGEHFHFYGGHRLWYAPEMMPRTYARDDNPVQVIPTPNGLTVIQPIEEQTGIEKSIQVSIAENEARVSLRHTLTNHGQEPVDCAAWAITQFRTGGTAILPQSQQETEMLPNRSLVLWPYSSMNNPYVAWGDNTILVRAEMQAAFKIGFPNPRGWLAYWLDGTLFVKHARFEPSANYYDFGSSSECYCNAQFLELETLGAVCRLQPGAAISHDETWELHRYAQRPDDEAAAQRMILELGLE